MHSLHTPLFSTPLSSQQTKTNKANAPLKHTTITTTTHACATAAVQVAGDADVLLTFSPDDEAWCVTRGEETVAVLPSTAEHPGQALSARARMRLCAGCAGCAG